MTSGLKMERGHIFHIKEKEKKNISKRNRKQVTRSTRKQVIR